MKARSWAGAMAASALIGCGPSGALSGTTPNIARGDAASANGDPRTAFAAYERALESDGLMAYERAEVLDRMAAADGRLEHLDAVAVYRRILEGQHAYTLGSADRALLLSRLVLAADGLEAKRRWREAIDVYDLVLREGKANVPNRKRVVESLRRAADEWARAEMARLASAPDSADKLSALGTARLAVHRASGRSRVYDELTRAMDATASGAFAEALRLEKEGNLDAALHYADVLVAPLARDSAPFVQRNELARRITARFETLVAEAQGYPGALALRTGWMLRATGRAHDARKDALTDLDRRARVEWRPVVTTSGCTEAARALLPEISGGKGVAITAKLEVGRCTPDAETTSRREPFTYYVTETYTTTENYTESVTEYAGQNCYGGGAGRTQTCTSQYRTRSVPRSRTVMKTRSVPRTGYRTITTTNFSYEVRGAVRFLVDEKLILHPFDGTGTATRVVTEGGPEGTHTEGGTAESAAELAFERASQVIAGGKERVDAERARVWLERAATAETQRRELEAEDAYATATRITGKASDRARSFTKVRLRMEDDPASVLAAEAPAPPASSTLAIKGDGDVHAKTPRDEAGADVEPPGRASGRERGGFRIDASYVSTNRISQAGTTEPARQAIGLHGGASLALVSRLVVPFGPTVLDAAHVGARIGVQIGEVTSDQKLSGDVQALFTADAGYTFLVGYRVTRAALFAGLDPQVRTLRLGDLRSYGIVAPLVLRGEIRLNGPAVLTMTAWAFSPVGTGDTLGAELGAPLSRDGWVLLGRGERTTTATSIAASGGGARTRIEAPEIWSFSIGIGKLL